MLWLQSQSHTMLEKQTSQNTCLCLRHISFHQTSLGNVSHHSSKNLEGHTAENQCRGAEGLSANITVWNLLWIFGAPSHKCHHTYNTTFCILKKYPVNRLSNRSLSKKVSFTKPLSWTSGTSVPVLQSAQPHICFSNIVVRKATFHNVKLAALPHTQLDNKAKMKQINLKLYSFCSPLSHCLSSGLNQGFTDTKLSIWLENSQLKHRWDLYKQNYAQAFFFSLFFLHNHFSKLYV